MGRSYYLRAPLTSRPRERKQFSAGSCGSGADRPQLADCRSCIWPRIWTHEAESACRVPEDRSAASDAKDTGKAYDNDDVGQWKNCGHFELQAWSVGEVNIYRIGVPRKSVFDTRSLLDESLLPSRLIAAAHMGSVVNIAISLMTSSQTGLSLTLIDGYRLVTP
jgi:hypothetical protein